MMKRSRGRPPKRKNKKLGKLPESTEIKLAVTNGSCEQTNSVIDISLKTTSRHDNNSKQTPGQRDLSDVEHQEPVICGVCLKNCDSQGQFELHAMEIHNGLARVVGTDQNFNESDELLALTKTLSTFKKLRCLKDDCGKEFISLAGYRYHLTACQNKVFGKCPICGKKILQSRVDIHVGQAHPVTETSSQLTPRDAAKRAREKLKCFIKANEDENQSAKPRKRLKHDENYEPDGDELRENSDCEDYTGPTQYINEIMLEEWEKELELNDSIACKNSGCEAIFNSVEDFKNHFLICSHSTAQLCYICSHCKMRFKNKSDVITHLDAHSLVRRNCDGFQRKFKTPDCSITFLKTFFKQNYSDAVFLDWQPRAKEWIPLSSDKYEAYLPTEVKSISFRTVDFSQSTASDWIKLNILSSNSKEDDKSLTPNTLFAGGPVWALSWCPTPANKRTNQYLALYCHQTMETKIPAQTAIRSPGMIQIWQMTDEKSLHSKFVLGVAQDFGAVWALEWCPSGCWEGDRIENDGILPRLGLLAAACSDGNIYIYSLPVPKSLHKTNELPIFRTNPAISLQTDPISSRFNCNLRHQCVSISWLRFKGHSKIAGGFADGTVALWDLTTKSPLLHQQVSRKGCVFSPYSIFQAHATIVNDLAWAPFCDGIFLATVGNDRQMLVWSTDNLSWPSNIYKSSKLLRINWSPFWCGTFMSADNCYNLLRNSLMYVDNGFHSNNSRCLIPQKGCIWDLTVNEWLNCIASCDSAGEVIGLLLPDVSTGIITKKSMSPCRFLIYKAELMELNNDREYDTLDKGNEKDGLVKEIDGGNILDNTLDNSQEFESQSKQNGTQTEPKSSTTYSKIRSKYGITFIDYTQSSSARNRRTFFNSKGATSCTATTFPITSINRISWNPNMGSHLLIASGGQSGLVRIHRIHQLSISKLEKMYQEETEIPLPDSPKMKTEDMT